MRGRNQRLFSYVSRERPGAARPSIARAAVSIPADAHCSRMVGSQPELTG